jgi:hypothetical protein
MLEPRWAAVESVQEGLPEDDSPLLDAYAGAVIGALAIAIGNPVARLSLRPVEVPATGA